ncbi:MAG TPA: GNAT family N-acetyltransferase, partial [Acidimicrobiales bacterium]|nr:GNAT family N-acetyltransferase [Acidimicrobiales bacterium]
MDGQQVARRPVAAADRDLLLAVYAATRAEELALVDWSEADKRAFVVMQFEAQDRHYREHYPSASFDVIVVDGERAGRLYVDRWRDEVRIVDIALLPEYRNAGIGTALLRGVMAEAAASGRKASIHVEVFNPAIRLYTRLGFAPVAERGVHLLMEWAPGSGDDGLVAHAAGVGAEGDEEQGKLAEVRVLEREGLLLDVAPVRGMEEERERDAPDVALPLLGRAGPGLLALGEHEVD